MYYDVGRSGLRKNGRTSYKKMIEDGLEGKFDYIITKSVSKFARNTLDILKDVRELRKHNVYFDKEKIDTARADSFEKYKCEIGHESKDEYLRGRTLKQIKELLENFNIKSPSGKDKWDCKTINNLLSNEKYIGNVFQQKTFVSDALTGKREANIGQIEKVYIKNNHDFKRIF